MIFTPRVLPCTPRHPPEERQRRVPPPRRRPTASTTPQKKANGEYHPPTGGRPGGPGGCPPGRALRAPGEGAESPEHSATPGGYGGKPPGVACIGVPTGARNAGSDAPTGDQSIDMNRTRKHPLVCQDPITTRSRDEPEQAQSLAGLVISGAGTGGAAAVYLVRFCGPAGVAGGRHLRLVLHEAAGVVRLAAAVGENDGEIWNADGADRRYRGEPA